MTTQDINIRAARVRLAQVIEVGVKKLSDGVDKNEFVQWCMDAVLNEREEVNRDEADAVLSKVYTDLMRESWWNAPIRGREIFTPAQLWSESAAGRYQVMDLINDLVRRTEENVKFWQSKGKRKAEIDAVTKDTYQGLRPVVDTSHTRNSEGTA